MRAAALFFCCPPAGSLQLQLFPPYPGPGRRSHDPLGLVEMGEKVMGQMRRLTYRNLMTVIRRIEAKGYDFQESERLARHIFAEFEARPQGMSIEELCLGFQAFIFCVCLFYILLVLPFHLADQVAFKRTFMCVNSLSLQTGSKCNGTGHSEFNP